MTEARLRIVGIVLDDDGDAVEADNLEVMPLQGVESRAARIMLKI